MRLGTSSFGRVQGSLLAFAEVSNQIFPHSWVHPEEKVCSPILLCCLSYCFRTCEIGWLGVSYPEWAEQEVLLRTQPRACLCNGGDTWAGHCASLMQTGEIFLWPGMAQPGGLALTFFICIGLNVWGKAHGKSTWTDGEWMRRREGENDAFPFSNVCNVQNQQRCTVTRLRESRWSGLEERLRCQWESAVPRLSLVQQRVCLLDEWKAPL